MLKRKLYTPSMLAEGSFSHKCNLRFDVRVSVGSVVHCEECDNYYIYKSRNYYSNGYSYYSNGYWDKLKGRKLRKYLRQIAEYEAKHEQSIENM